MHSSVRDRGFNFATKQQLGWRIHFRVFVFLFLTVKMGEDETGKTLTEL